ncbi:uncharacterized protein B0H18DRAFT_995279 [Fomitopsis serialis]|uniref:uncharacterized protein n=1 Tax=Fomitopsis serialis TaxID=139415 RepID=UPI0020088EDA|nr:uncharacterized protein B0H18DRAFT_995279 [Neoantrodia serialis]KAH9930120.1 hypothetical protein B0H18DRAFT_995279 [Neoantrodia serialis]
MNTLHIDTLVHPVKSVAVHHAYAEVVRTFSISLQAGRRRISIAHLSSSIDPLSLQVSLAHSNDRLDAHYKVDEFSTSPGVDGDTPRPLPVLLAQQCGPRDSWETEEKCGCALCTNRTAENQGAQSTTNPPHQTDVSRRIGQAEAYVSLDVEAPEKCALGLILRYKVSGTSWKPYYDLRATAELVDGHLTPAVSIDYNVRVKQTTGEDWEDAMYTFVREPTPATSSVDDLYGDGTSPPHSTNLATSAYPDMLVSSTVLVGTTATSAFPQINVAPLPERGLSASQMAAQPFVPVPPIAIEMLWRERPFGSVSAGLFPAQSASSLGPDNYLDSRASDAPPNRGPDPPPTTQSVSLSSAQPQTVRCDGTAHVVNIASFLLDATYTWICAPRVRPGAFVECRARHCGECTLVAGELTAYVDGEEVARTSIEDVAPGESFRVPLGLDSAVHLVHRRTLHTDADAARPFSEQTWTTRRLTRYVVMNTNPFHIPTLILRDALPVSTYPQRGLLVCAVKEIDADAEEDKPITMATMAGMGAVLGANVREAEGRQGEGVFEWVRGLGAGESAALQAEWMVQGSSGVTWEEVTR